MPLIIIGLIAMYRSLATEKRSYVWLSSIVALSMGMLFYALAVGIDGIVLPYAAKQLLSAATLIETSIATYLQTTIHAFAAGMSFASSNFSRCSNNGFWIIKISWESISRVDRIAIRMFWGLRDDSGCCRYSHAL